MTDQWPSKLTRLMNYWPMLLLCEDIIYCEWPTDSEEMTLTIEGQYNGPIEDLDHWYWLFNDNDPIVKKVEWPVIQYCIADNCSMTMTDYYYYCVCNTVLVMTETIIQTNDLIPDYWLLNIIVQWRRQKVTRWQWLMWRLLLLLVNNELLLIIIVMTEILKTNEWRYYYWRQYYYY